MFGNTSRSVLLLIAVIMLSIAFNNSPCLSQSELDVDKQRAEDREKLGSSVPDPGKLRNIAETVFSTPIENQDERDLFFISKQSNHYANLVGYIIDEYDDYLNSNYRYDFIRNKVSPSRDSYVKVANEFKQFRNQAYFNLGIKSKSNGNYIEAFLWFRDAYRLSSFDCESRARRDTCMRWKAEQELQNLLDLSHLKAYVTWED